MDVEKYLVNGDYSFAADLIRLNEPLLGRNINFSQIVEGERLLERLVKSKDIASRTVLSSLAGITNDYQVCLTGKNSFSGLEDFDYFKLSRGELSIFDMARTDKTKFSILEKVFRNKNKQLDFEEVGLSGDSPKSDLEDINLRLSRSIKVEELLKGPGSGVDKLSFEEIQDTVAKLKLDTINVPYKDGSSRNYYSEVMSELDKFDFYNETTKKLVDSTLSVKSLDRTIEIIAEKEAELRVEEIKKQYES